MRVEKLLQLVKNADERAFEKLYEQTSALVFSVALAIVRTKQDAEDITADTFVCIWQKADTYRGGSGKSWICAIARNFALNLVKKRKREADCELQENAMQYGIEGEIESKMVLETALSILNEKERETVLLYNNGLKHREIAEITGESLGTVTWRYKNALEKMRNFLGG